MRDLKPASAATAAARMFKQFNRTRWASYLCAVAFIHPLNDLYAIMPSLWQAPSSSGEDSISESSSSQPKRKGTPNEPPTRRELSEYPTEIYQRLRELDPVAFAFGSLTTIMAMRIYASFRRIPSAAWVTPDLMKKKWIKGVVTRCA